MVRLNREYEMSFLDKGAYFLGKYNILMQIDFSKDSNSISDCLTSIFPENFQIFSA